MVKLVPSTVEITSCVYTLNGRFSSRTTSKKASPLSEITRSPLLKFAEMRIVLLGFSTTIEESGSLIIFTSLDSLTISFSADEICALPVWFCWIPFQYYK